MIAAPERRGRMVVNVQRGIMRTRTAAVLAAMLVAAPVGVRAAGHMQPGLWEVTATVELPGVASPPPTTQTECLSQKDVDAELVPEIEKGSCKVTNIRRSGDRVTWLVDCGEVGKGDGEIVYRSPTAYEGWMKLATGGRWCVPRSAPAASAAADHGDTVSVPTWISRNDETARLRRLRCQTYLLRNVFEISSGAGLPKGCRGSPSSATHVSYISQTRRYVPGTSLTSR